MNFGWREGFGESRRSPRLASFAECGAQDWLEDIRLSDETQVARMRTIGGTLSVVSEQIVSAHVVQLGDALLLEFVEALPERGVIVGVKLIQLRQDP